MRIDAHAQEEMRIDAKIFARHTNALQRGTQSNHWFFFAFEDVQDVMKDIGG